MKRYWSILLIVLFSGFIIGTISNKVSPTRLELKKISHSPDITKHTETNNSPISIVFGGDTMMDWSVRETINNNGEGFPWKNIKNFVTEKDLAILNLETAITQKGTPENKQFTFRSDPLTLKGVKEAGFDVVSLANNHSMDYGEQGLLDTIKHLKNEGISYIGAGKDEKEAFAPVTKNVNGKKITFIGFSKVLPHGGWYAGNNKPGIGNGYELENMYKRVEKAKSNSDFLFVYIHWGIEKEVNFNKEQQAIAHNLIRNGADAVVGSHPHVLQGIEFYNEKPIVYSLGNFLFPNYVQGESAETGMMEIIIKPEGTTELKFHPMIIKNDQIHFEEKRNVKNRLEKLLNRSHNQTELNKDLFKQK